MFFEEEHPLVGPPAASVGSGPPTLEESVPVRFRNGTDPTGTDRITAVSLKDLEILGTPLVQGPLRRPGQLCPGEAGDLEGLGILVKYLGRGLGALRARGLGLLQHERGIR